MGKMKLYSIIALIFMFLFAASLCSCHCNVYNYDWHIIRIYHEVSFVNGQTLPVYTDSLVYNLNPIGVSQSDAYIVFNKDGTVVFKPYGADEMCGTYELTHNGFFYDTNFNVTFENGEKIESGYAVSYYGNDELEFEFKGIKYYFYTSFSSSSATLEENQRRTEWVIDEVRNFAAVNLRTGSVTVNENGTYLSSASLDSDIDLLKDGYGVLAVHITADNELYVLDALREGECVFIEYIGYGTDKDRIIIYYVDPLPSELPPEEPARYEIYELIPQLKYYMDNPQNIDLKLYAEHSPAKPGEFNKYLTVTKSEDVAVWLKNFFDIILIESCEPPYGIEQPHIKYGVRLTDKEGENPSVIVYCDYGSIYYNGKWYDIDLEKGSFPTWAGYSVYGFSCNDYNARVEESNQYFSLEKIEFLTDKNQNYEYPESHSTITIIGECGEINVFDATHFYYNGSYYIVTEDSERNFASLFQAE